MVGPSKILTVSYGTFSCTLEGFDDPFNTMKAIAEYFRDLAADDRYFGAEPPVPDAAMLHRIAEREMQRRVEARVQDGGVLLRASDPSEAQAAAPAAAAPAPRAAPAKPEAPRAPRLNAAGPSIEDSVAAKLARIRAAVDRARVAPTPVAEIEEAEEIAPHPAAVPEAEGGAAMRAAAEVAVPDDIAAPAEPAVGPAEARQPADESAPPAPLAPAPEGADEATVPAGAAPHDPRDGATQPDDDEPATATPGHAVDAAADVPADDGPAVDLLASRETVEAAAAQPDAPPAARVADRTEAATPGGASAAPAPGRSADMLAPPAAASDWADADDADIDTLSLMADLRAADLRAADHEAAGAGSAGPVPAAAAVSNADAGPAPEAGDPDLEAMIGRLAGAPQPAARFEADPDPAALADAHGADEAPADARPAATVAATDATDAPEAAPASDPVPASDVPAAGAAPVTPVRARVVKVRRIERPAAVVPPEALLSPEAEAELARELAEVEREMTGAAAEPAAGPRAAPADAAVSRLIRQTNTEMDGAETRRRAATIAHLKAAVAVTVADEAAGVGRAGERDRTEPYRDDLAEAVRPRRPEALPGTGRRRPDSGARIPPLVLVSEQRIDKPAPAPAKVETGPIRPRRVTSGSLALTRDLAADIDDEGDAAGKGDENIFAAPDRFVAVAERLGVSQLPDLIETAAAYIVVFEGRETFTRPQVVRLAATCADEEPEREDGLRAFGQLLRDGRIVKARRGLFALPETSRILAETRATAT
ncbi:MAG: hypothetical protein ACK4TB_03955 [Gemmobacter sp.]